MKRLITLALALCLTLGLAAQASAITVQPSGVMDFVFSYSNSNAGPDAFRDAESDRFRVTQRSRIQVDFIASENLRGVMMLQFGTWEWGKPDGDYGPGAALDTTSGTPLVRRLYIDFNFPDSPVNVKMGLMDLVLPYATFGQPVFGNHVAAVTATANVSDNASLTAFWARPLRGSFKDASNDVMLHDNDMDVFGLWANLDFDSFTLAPWAAYASIGSNSGWFGRAAGVAEDLLPVHPQGLNDETANWWGAGLALKVMPTDALTIKFDAMYAKLSDDVELLNEKIEASGYYFALAVDYAMDWGTPGFFAIYSSGDDADDDGKIGRIPGLAYDDNVWATRMAFAGSMTCGKDSYISQTGIGLWMVGLQVADLSFIENVNHTARLAYIRGTNNIESTIIQAVAVPGSPIWNGGFGAMLPLAKEDQAWEIGFDTYWQMYENLTVGLELGYIYLDASDKYDRDEIYNREGVFSGNLIFRFGF